MDDTASRAELMALRARVLALENILLLVVGGELDRDLVLSTLRAQFVDMDMMPPDGHAIENERPGERAALSAAARTIVAGFIDSAEE